MPIILLKDKIRYLAQTASAELGGTAVPGITNPASGAAVLPPPREICVYSRYADDVVLSTEKREVNRAQAISVIGKIYSLMAEFGLSPNIAKTRVSPPGSRKVVLGLLVDGPLPRLSREFRYNLRRHLHYLHHPDVGPARHAHARAFASIDGMKNHVRGLIAFAHDIDPMFAKACAIQFNQIDWPI